MGMIQVQFSGSFSTRIGDKKLTAQLHGHTAAVEELIEYLDKTVKPIAIEQDVGLAQRGEFPNDGFGPTIKAILDKEKQ